MYDITIEVSQLNLDPIRARAFDMRWLTADGSTAVNSRPMEPATVDGSARAVLAHLIGVDVPDLVNEVLRLRAALAAYHDAIADRAPTGGTR
ncbi:hypothetical protein [Nonomuraea sp. SYSU D8015]|uniref:hypothetical protein n=1 Tax=Nonomuraea sp. SYSU D8015 TaxID=2593644 RepID=UPI0016616A2B|nr:hypothetical protein [Nonomuraea sp. SYSU D8015]